MNNLNENVMNVSFKAAVVEDGKDNTQAQMDMSIYEHYDGAIKDLFDVETGQEVIEQITPAVIDLLDMSGELEQIRTSGKLPEFELNLGFVTGVACALHAANNEI